MKDFLKYTLASIVGTAISFFVVFFVAFAIVAGAITSALSDLDTSKRSVSVKDGSILALKLNRPISDRGPEQDFQFNFGGISSGAPLGLNQILEAIQNASDDSRISGIYLDVSMLQAGMATVEEIRNALIEFKKSDKWIISYGEIFSQKAFYLASVSDEIYVYPEGMLDFRGLSVNMPFYKRMLDKLEIEAQVIRGSNNKFKSFAEPFVQEEMSQANRAQTENWLNDLWNVMLSGLSASTSIEQNRLSEIASSYEVQSPADALRLGLVTGVVYEDELKSRLKHKTETGQDEKLKMVSLADYRRSPPSDRKSKFVPSYKKSKVAVIFAEGGIVSGKAGDDSIGSETFAEALREAREDSTVKAVVLRINSGGGSALASDVIHRETILLKGTKPFVVSMGDVAASGGYYIASAADRIVAMPNTITGSIGVIGLFPNMKGFFNNKIGITFDQVKTSSYADFMDVSRPLSDAEYKLVQNSVDRTYSVFLKRVADGRGMSLSRVDSLGQGQVYSGVDALELGLVDTLGGLEAAIEIAARLAGLDDYTTKALPKRKDPFKEFLESLQSRAALTFIRNELGYDERLLNHLKTIRDVSSMSGIQMHMLYIPLVE